MTSLSGLRVLDVQVKILCVSAVAITLHLQFLHACLVACPGYMQSVVMTMFRA